jgi:outer membrane lipoprotein SlyB
MRHILALILCATATGFTVPNVAMAQSRSEDAVAVCATQRAPFVTMRSRNREEIVGRTVTGVLGGALAGGLLGSAATQNQSSKAQRNATAVGAVLGGLAGGIDQYLDAKRQIAKDNRELMRMIDDDARSQAGKVGSLISSINATGTCRQNQVNAWEQRLIATRTEFVQRERARAAALAAAPDDKAKRNVEKENRRLAKEDGRVLELMGREEAQIKGAIEDDAKLFADVLQYFDSDIMAMAEAQSRVQGTSTASLRGPAEAYTVQVIPPAILAAQSSFTSGQSAFGSTGSAFGSSAQPAPATRATAATPISSGPPPVYTQSTTALRATAAAQGKVIVNLPPGTEVQSLGEADGAPGWIEITHEGRSGFVQATRLGPKRPAGLAGDDKAPAASRAAQVPPWQAQIIRPQVTASNGHQAALIAQRDANAEAQATTQTGLARLQYAVQRGNAVGTGS